MNSSKKIGIRVDIGLHMVQLRILEVTTKGCDMASIIIVKGLQGTSKDSNKKYTITKILIDRRIQY